MKHRELHRSCDVGMLLFGRLHSGEGLGRSREGDRAMHGEAAMLAGCWLTVACYSGLGSWMRRKSVGVRAGLRLPGQG